MNKFITRVKVDKKRAKTPQKKSALSVDAEDLAALEQFHTDWCNLSEMRAKAARAERYAWGDQWGDLVRDPDTGQMITEGELIKKNGKVPLKNNMIAPIWNNIEGQCRTAQVKPVCVVRDQREAKLGEMVSIAVEYVHDINETGELDVATLKSNATAGVMAQRVEYGVNPRNGKQDVWLYPVDPKRLFFDTSVEDPRMWDMSRVGELYDMTTEDVIATFGKYVPEQELRSIYGEGGNYLDSNALNGDKLNSLNFYTPAQPNMCRVILGWRLENRPAIYYHDWENGTYGYVKRSEKHILDEENERRMEYYTSQGVAEEDIPLIEYETNETERVWVFRYMTPWGHCLYKGDSPYWHGEHNYVLGVYHMTSGHLYNYFEQFIDQQRSINRTATLIDFMRGASSKGVMVVDETAFESMTREEIVDEYVRWNGVLFVKPKNGVNVRDVVHQINGGASTAGDYELLNLQLKLINEISGVNSAMQGQAPNSGTPASLYAQQVQNSSLNLKGLFGSLTAFRRRRDTKVMQTIQQYYNEPKYLDLAGRDYSEEAKWYNPDKVKNALIDLTVTEGNNSPAYQVLQNDFLYNLFAGGAIDLATMLENTSYPFATKLLEAVKRKEQQAQEAMAQYQQQAGQAVNGQAMSPQFQQAMNGTPGAQDGVIFKGEN